MTMERRHFEFVAEVIAEANDVVDIDTRRHLSCRFANKLAATNPNFNRDRFLRACGVED